MRTLPKSLEPHHFAALFPELPSAELTLLARDIKTRGQLEPIVVYKGLILDGRNRYRACQIAGVKPRIEEFNERVAKGSPEDFVLSRNLRRRHLSMGQKATLALDWSEQMELNPDPERTKTSGRPRGTLSEAAKCIGINEQRVFEARQIRDANPGLYKEVKAGLRSLTSALMEINPPRKDQFHEFSSKQRGSASEEFDGERQKVSRDVAPANLKIEISREAAPVNLKAALSVQKPASKEAEAAVRPPPGRTAIERALARIKAVLGNWFYAEVKARNLIQKPEEIVHFARLTDAQMLEIGSLLKRGWTFAAALREVIERLTPDDEIRALHTRAVANGEKWYLSSVGGFGHVVVWGTEIDKTLAKVKETLARQ
jgi:hypothetical protein